MIHAELQNLVEDLATKLDAPALLEDQEQRVIVYSTHSEPIDEIRRDSILRRVTRPATKVWFRQFGITKATGPIRIPRDPDAGVLGRLCVPVRYLNRLMGFLWLIDDDHRLGPAETAISQATAGQIGVILYEDELNRSLAGNALTRLLSPSATLREMAVQQIAESATFDVRAPFAIIVVQPLGTGDGEVSSSIADALSEVSRRILTTKHLHLAYADHGVLLVQLRSLEDDGRARRLAQDVRESLLRRRGRDDPGQRVVAAVGEPQERLLTSVKSYRQAKLSVEISRLVPSVGDLPRWRDLGVYRILAQLPPDEAAISGLDPRLATVLRSGDEPVVLTLETYLELGCDAKATAERLHLHRGTLYYRLQKAERIGGIDLRDGNDRLAVHLGFKLARFTGLLRTPLP